MHEQPILTEAEWRLVVQLLQQELEELPTEIHHTQALDYRHQLQEKRQMIQSLLDRLAPVVAA
jgi:tRNA/tmRNA/rRNA uracil-C5-methylase (TrmA/RlmC/RlmD family)